MREGLIISTVLMAVGYMGWAHAEWRIKRYLIRIDTLADELAQERAESKRLGNVLNSMTNHPSVRRTGTGYVMPVDTRRGRSDRDPHHTTGSATCGRSSATAATNWNSTRTR